MLILHQGFQLTSSEVNWAVVITLVVALVTLFVVFEIGRRQLILMNKQDRINDMLVSLLSRVSVVPISDATRNVFIINVGQIDVWLYSMKVNDNDPTVFEIPMWLPPAGDAFSKNLSLESTGNLPAGNYRVEIGIKDSLKREWALTFIAVKENAHLRGFDKISTLSLQMHPGNHP